MILQVKGRSSPVLAALILVDAAGAATAIRHRVSGEPFGLGAELDVRRPAVLFFWGTGLSAPFVMLIGAAAIANRAPGTLRILGGLFAVGALSEPVFWGRRRCPTYARVLLAAHVALGIALAVCPALAVGPTESQPSWPSGPEVALRAPERSSLRRGPRT